MVKGLQLYTKYSTLNYKWLSIYLPKYYYHAFKLILANMCTHNHHTFQVAKLLIWIPMLSAFYSRYYQL